MRINDQGFSYATSSGGGSVKFVDLTDEMQKEIGFDPQAKTEPVAGTAPATATSATPAQSGAVYDEATKQNTAAQQTLRAEIAQLKAEIARAQSLSSSASTQTMENKIIRKEAEIKIKAQEARVIQEQRTASMIGANVQPTGNPTVDAAVEKSNQLKRKLAEKKIRKESIMVEIMRNELLNPNSTVSANNQSQLDYIARDMPILQAEIQAADAAAQAAKAAAQVR